MGLRGVGSSKQRTASTEYDESESLPWEAVGLDRPGRVIAFLQWLPITKGILQGHKMELLPEQIEFIQKVYGQVDEDGARLIRIAVQSEPKGNGKTGMTAGICLCHLVGPEAELRGEVYSAAIDRAQAAIIFEEMEATIMATPWIADRVNVQRFHKRIEVVMGDGEGSKYESLSSDARGAHGRAPSLWVYDELAQAKDRRLLDNLVQGMSKRDEALGIILSTQAPNDEHPLSELIDDGLSGGDPSVYVQLICAPEDANPFSEETLKACNPAWGKFLNTKDLMTQADRARRIPSMEPGFRNLRLNQRVHATEEDHMLTALLWKAGAVAPFIQPGARCFGGLDLSGKNDLSALVLVFPSDDPEPSYGIKPFFWTPEGQLEARRPAEEDLFRQWIKQGHIESIKGKIINYHQIALRLGELAEVYDIQAVAFDSWRIDEFKIEMADLGVSVPMIPFIQGYKSMSPAIEKVQELALQNKLFHGGHPVLKSCVLNAKLVRNEGTGDMKIDKSRVSSGAIRIDGAVAMAMAIGLASKSEENAASGSVIFA